MPTSWANLQTLAGTALEQPQTLQDKESAPNPTLSNKSTPSTT